MCGAAAVLLLPPFYYKNAMQEGIYAFVSTVIEQVGARAPRIMLYHIPQMGAGIGWSIDLIGRLRTAFPEIIAGIKDSAGDADHTIALIDAFPDFAVFPGAEVYLLEALRRGASGCISATANVNTRGIVKLLEGKDGPEAEALQEQLKAVRNAIQSRGLIPAIKAVLAARYGDDTWRNVRPPLQPASAEVQAELAAEPALAPIISS